MLENGYKDYGDWDLRTLEVVPFLKAIPLCMLLSLPIGLWLTNNIILWLVIGALVGVVVACEEIFEKRIAQTEHFINNNDENSVEETFEINPQQGEGGASI